MPFSPDGRRHVIACARINVRQARRVGDDTPARSEQSRNTTAEASASSLDEAMEMIADRIVRTRAETWQDETEDGNPARRTMGIANLGGATLDNEENYLMKKLLTALGVIQVENQARI